MTDETPQTDSPEKSVRRKTPPATPAVQAWLDGDEAREHLTLPDERETAEFWTRINLEAARLGRRTTPIHVRSKILSSLPDGPPAPAPATGFRPGISVMIIGAAVILIIGAMIGVMLVR